MAAMNAIRAAAELADVDDPRWPDLLKEFEEADVPVRVLSVDPELDRRTLYRLQVTARSTLGGFALNRGGLLIDHGWMRMLGAGSDGLPDIATASGLASRPRPAPRRRT
jgi:hypothetical protein